MNNISKSVRSHPKPWQDMLRVMGLIFCLFAITLAGCSTEPEPMNESYTAQDFSITYETVENKIRVNLLISNPGDTEFPGDPEFKGIMRLWTPSEETNGWAETSILPKIGPGETLEVVSVSWAIDPGIFYLTWGNPEYGGVVTIIAVEKMLSGDLEVVWETSFQTKPTSYGSMIHNCGTIESPSLSENGRLIFAGETSIPDDGYLFPVLFSEDGLVEGFPIGKSVQAAGGRWAVELTVSPDEGGIVLEDGQFYHLVLFSDDLRIAPTEPFEVLFPLPSTN